MVSKFRIFILLTILGVVISSCSIINVEFNDLFSGINRKKILVEIPENLPATNKWFSFTAGDIHQVFYYKPPVNIPLSELAEKYPAIILTGRDEAERDEIIASGQKNPILRYILFNQIKTQIDCSETPWQNQAAYLPGDYCRINSEHPDWFLRDKRNNIVSENENNYNWMDPLNSEWRAFFTDRAISYQESNQWGGFFFDNVEASWDKPVREGAFSGFKYFTDEESYLDAIAGFLKYSSEKIRAIFPDQPILANIIEINYFSSASLNAVYRYLEYLDGIMIEDFAVDWDSGYKSEAQWEAQMDLIENTQKLGRNVILSSSSQNDSGNMDRIAFSLGSYLLVDRGLTVFRYVENDLQKAVHYNIFDLSLGAPSGYRYQKNGVWYRDFENGTVMIDPAAHSAAINVN